MKSLGTTAGHVLELLGAPHRVAFKLCKLCGIAHSSRRLESRQKVLLLILFPACSLCPQPTLLSTGCHYSNADLNFEAPFLGICTANCLKSQCPVEWRACARVSNCRLSTGNFLLSSLWPIVSSLLVYTPL